MKKVLVVDDEKLIVKGLRFSLEQDDMEVDTAYDGGEAIEKIKASDDDSFAGYNDTCIHRNRGLPDGQRVFQCSYYYAHCKGWGYG